MVYWFIGFIEGRSNFHVGLRNIKDDVNYPFDTYPLLHFRIFLREDDLSVLEEIRKFLGFSNIYKKSLKNNRELGFKSKDQYNFVVSHTRDLLNLKKLFYDAVFHTKKGNDINLFFKILDMRIAKKHLQKEGYKEMLELIKQLNSKNRDNFKPGSNKNLYSQLRTI